MIDRDSIIEQLITFYYDHDSFQSSYLPYDRIKPIYENLFDKDRILVYIEDGKLLGYCENLRIGYEEFGKILCGINVYENLDSWQICNGPLAYVANITIHPAHRQSKVIKDLTRQFFLKNKDAKHFVGRAFRKKHQPIKVFDFHESYLKWIKEE